MIFVPPHNSAVAVKQNAATLCAQRQLPRCTAQKAQVTARLRTEITSSVSSVLCVAEAHCTAVAAAAVDVHVCQAHRTLPGAVADLFALCHMAGKRRALTWHTVVIMVDMFYHHVSFSAAARSWLAAEMPDCIYTSNDMCAYPGQGFC